MVETRGSQLESRIDSLLTTEFTTRTGLSRFVVSVQLVGENVGRLVVAARNIYSKNYGSCISVHSSRQVPRRCIGGSYARDAVRYVKAEHVNEFIRARRLFFAPSPPPPILLFFPLFLFNWRASSKPLRRKKAIGTRVRIFLSN